MHGPDFLKNTTKTLSDLQRKGGGKGAFKKHVEGSVPPRVGSVDKSKSLWDTQLAEKHSAHTAKRKHAFISKRAFVLYAIRM